jgi:FkbM family methyltransferase
MIKQRLLGLRKIFTHAPFENALMLFVGGTEYGSSTAKVIPPPAMYKAGITKRVTREGIVYELDRSCLMQWYVYWAFREAARAKLYSLVKKGDVVLDVGTNIGETLLNFAKLVGREGFVYGFEPDTVNFQNVQQNIALNHFENVHVFDFGVSDKHETVNLYRVDEHNLGMNRILSEAESVAFHDFTTIETRTLDHVMSEHAITRVDLIKIDIEGYEMHALRGAQQLLSRLSPKLFIEVGYSRLLKHGTTPNEMIDLLNSFGYVVRHAETDELVDAKYDFSPLGDGGIDVYAIASR